MTEVAKHEPATPVVRDWWSKILDEWAAPGWLPDVWRGRFVEGLEPMRVEEFRDADTLVVKVEMPGLDPAKDVQIDVTDHALRIHAERREQERKDVKDGFRTEFRYGSFARTLRLPEGVSEDDVKATYKDGILEVRVPVDETRAHARRVEVVRG